MSYLSDFEHSFIEHTLALVDSYKGDFDVTLMINCLLGLLVLPKEQFLDHIPDEPLTALKKWGIDPSSIRCAGRPTQANPHPETLRGLVTNLRHAIAHFNVRPFPPTKDVDYFEYTNKAGLHAEVSIAEMRAFVRALSKHLASQ